MLEQPNVIGSFMAGQNRRRRENYIASLGELQAPESRISPAGAPGMPRNEAMAAHGGPTRTAASAMSGDWLRYANEGATRNLPLSEQLTSALSFLPEMGVTMEVFSGGQPGKGSGAPRVGSTRHDHGDAADVFFYKDGRKLDWANPDDRPIFEEIVRRGRASGLTGFGAGQNYMQPGSMHIGFGNEAVWGAGGKGANAPGWLRAAYSGPMQKFSGA